MNIITLNRVLLNNTPLNYRRKRILTEKDFYFKTIERTFTFSKSAGGKIIKDGRAYIKRIRGNSVVWNQIVSNSLNPNTPNMSINKNGNSYTFNVAGTNVINQLSAKISQASKVGHIYLFIRIGDNSLGKIPTLKLGTSYLAVPSEYNFLTAADESTIAFYPWGGTAETISEGEATYTLCLIDLTKMFGAGNEPSTIEEFNARVATLGVDMNAYNEGQVIHCNTESIKSVGDNAWDEEWELGSGNSSTGDILSGNSIVSKNYIPIVGGEEYYISSPTHAYLYFYDSEKKHIAIGSFIKQNTKFIVPTNARYMRFQIDGTYGTTYNHDIMITLVHSGWKQDTDAGYQPYWQDILPLPIISKYFPDGMKSAGNACDVIDCKKKQAITKVGVASNLSFSQMQEGVFYVDLPNMKLPTSTMERMKGIFTNRYAVETDSPSVGNMADKSIIRFADGNIYIKDMSYTNADEFNTANADLIVCYELADPIVTELDAEDQNFRDYYNVADFGTEQSQSSVPSAALLADVGYYFKKSEVKELTLN